MHAPRALPHTATRCSTLQHIAAHCNTQLTRHGHEKDCSVSIVCCTVCCSVLQCAAACCSACHTTEPLCSVDKPLTSAAYGMATVSRIDKITGLFCRILSLLQSSFAKETCNFIDPTNQSYPIVQSSALHVWTLLPLVHLEFTAVCVSPALYLETVLHWRASDERCPVQS